MKRRIARFLAGRAPRSAPGLADLESLHEAPQNPDFNDSFYFSGHDGKTGFFTRLGFRTTGAAEVWLCVDSPEFGVLELDADRDRNSGARPDISWGPLCYRCVLPGKKWRIGYDGPLRSGKKTVRAVLDLEYEAGMDIFDFKRHGDPGPLAEALAAEKWNRTWFRKLKELSQIHYEQGGRLRGSLSVGRKRVNLDLASLRDHSFGTRDWSAMNRHIWLAVMLEDGRFINISLVDYEFLHGMKAGYIADASSFTPLSSCSSFEEISGKPGTPRSFLLRFAPRGGRVMEVKASVDRHFEFLMGGCYSIHEGLAHYTVDGLKGFGIAEFGFNGSIYG